VIAQGNLFEAFAEYGDDPPTTWWVRARRCAGSIDRDGTAAGNQLSPRPARTDKDYIQPFFEQLYNQTNLKYTGPNTTTQTIGRVDLAFLRCCDRDGDDEVGVVLHYFRMLYSFNPAPAPTGVTPASPFHAPTANFQQNRDKYMDDCSKNMVALQRKRRVNTVRAQLLSKKATDKLKAQVVTSASAAAAGAHFNLRSCAPARGQLGGRA
jgi:hypothetical protein